MKRTTYLIRRDDKTALRLPRSTIRDGILRGPNDEVVVNGEHAKALGVELGPIKALMQAGKWDELIAQHEGILAHEGDNPTGMRVVSSGGYNAERQAEAELAILAQHAESTPEGNNRHAGTCERCGVGVPPGYGIWQRCGMDMGCMEHMDQDGSHLWCADEAACERRQRENCEREYKQAMREAKVHVSSRGWGDYSPVQWQGDLTRPTADIIAECRALLASAHDVDQPEQTDDELADAIEDARKRIEKKRSA